MQNTLEKINWLPVRAAEGIAKEKLAEIIKLDGAMIVSNSKGGINSKNLDMVNVFHFELVN